MSPEFVAAKKKIEELKSRKTWEAVYVSKSPRSSNLICGRFVFEIKNIGTKYVSAKAK